MTRTNIAMCFPKLDRSAQKRLTRQSLIHTSQLLFELPLVFSLPEADVRRMVVEYSGEKWLLDALAGGSGVLLLVPHIGNWELISQHLGPIGVTALYKPRRRPGLDAGLRVRRARRGARLFAADRQGVRSVLKTLKQGGLVALLPDQVPDPAAGIPADFFHRPALTMVLPARLAAATGCRVALGCAIRCAGGFRLEVSPLPALEKPAPESPPDVSSATHALNQAIEQLVRRFPAQYQWEYKRFKRLPGADVDPYLRNKP